MHLRNTRAGRCGRRALPLLALAFCALHAGAAGAQGAEAAAEEAPPAVPELIGPCAPPANIALPEGAELAELRALIKSVKAYIGAGENYIVCLTKYETTLGVDAEARAQLVASHNAMVDAMQATAAHFNKALKAARDAED